MTDQSRCSLPIGAVGVRRGALLALYGTGLYLLAILMASYPSQQGPWWSVRQFTDSARTIWTAWIATDGVGIFEALGYLGIAVVVLGLGWYWFGRPAYVAVRGASERRDRSSSAAATAPGNPPLQGNARNAGIVLLWALGGVLIGYGPLRSVARGAFGASVVQGVLIIGALATGYYVATKRTDRAAAVPHRDRDGRRFEPVLALAAAGGIGGTVVGYVFARDLRLLQSSGEMLVRRVPADLAVAVATFAVVIVVLTRSYGGQRSADAAEGRTEPRTQPAPTEVPPLLPDPELARRRALPPARDGSRSGDDFETDREVLDEVVEAAIRARRVKTLAERRGRTR